jgi:malonyl-CoA O-methyltransferase
MLRPSVLDPKAVRRQADRRAHAGEARDFIAREVERRMRERLDLVRLTPALIVDVGCGRGAGSRVLAGRWPQARCLAVDLSPAALRHTGGPPRTPAVRIAGWLARAGAALRTVTGAGADAGAANVVAGAAPPAGAVLAVAADTHRLPLPASSADLIWSNLAWHQFADPGAVLAEWQRVVRPGGLLMFSAFGVDTLRALPGAAPGLTDFPDMHDVGDALVGAGFAEPVMDVDRIVLGYREPLDLVAELRAALGGNPRAGRRRGLVGRSVRAAALARLEAARGPDGLIPVELEIIHGHAWCPPVKRLPAGLAPLRFMPRGASPGG